MMELGSESLSREEVGYLQSPAECHRKLSTPEAAQHIKKNYASHTHSLRIDADLTGNCWPLSRVQATTNGFSVHGVLGGVPVARVDFNFYVFALLVSDFELPAVGSHDLHLQLAVSPV